MPVRIVLRMLFDSGPWTADPLRNGPVERGVEQICKDEDEAEGLVCWIRKKTSQSWFGAPNINDE
ncbi:hypothetical protein MUK42_24446 [Musa troglodytarum]|uniref:Uncharacterized protein n=1 Tax=Musa troglodytarum TaxID=320322 RepID=A0A9E7FJI8_9LILI|nr:hypothetical protein MUK42_24446 [Musa troglodytarum]URD97060.1 hypothetical protein MUK42_24446 [Musa troglodytarum]